MRFKRNGILLMTLSGILFGFLPILVKWGNQYHFGAVQTSFCRFAIALAGIALLHYYGPQKLKVVNLEALLWRGLLGGLTVLLYFITLQLTTAAKGTLLNYTYSIWANVFGVLFLKHKPPKGFALILLLAGIGVWLVLGVSFDHFEWGDLTGVLSGMAAGGGVAAIKVARKTDNALTVFGSFSFFGFFFAGLGLLVIPWMGGFCSDLGRFQPLDPAGFSILLLMGLCAMGAQLLFTHGYGYTSFAMGTLLSLITPILAALLGWVCLGEPLTSHFILGTLLVLSACLILGWHEGKPKNQLASL
jgi:drug/metabolite transporter (DMT)-like permease